MVVYILLNAAVSLAFIFGGLLRLWSKDEFENFQFSPKKRYINLASPIILAIFYVVFILKFVEISVLFFAVGMLLSAALNSKKIIENSIVQGILFFAVSTLILFII